MNFLVYENLVINFLHSNEFMKDLCNENIKNEFTFEIFFN